MMEENKITEYLDGTLPKSEFEAFEKQLLVDAELQKEVDEFRALFEAIKNEKMEAPSDKLTSNFEKLLEEEKSNQVKVVSIKSKPNNGIYNMFKIAASIALLITAFFIGKYSQQNEFENEYAVLEQEALNVKQTAMISLLENQSASKRIQGVQYINHFIDPDEEIIRALADRMLHDENTNVRLSAVEALSNFKNAESVKMAFIGALETEKDPSIQIAIIQNLVEIQEKKAIGPMQQLLEQEETQPFIKEEITNAIPKII